MYAAQYLVSESLRGEKGTAMELEEAVIRTGHFAKYCLYELDLWIKGDPVSGGVTTRNVASRRPISFVLRR